MKRNVKVIENGQRIKKHKRIGALRLIQTRCVGCLVDRTLVERVEGSYGPKLLCL